MEGRPLYLGGVLIPHSKGLLGHSDGDCLIHAVIDALSGAAGLPDIGGQFPDSDPEFKNIRSTVLLKKVSEKLKVKSLSIINIDSVIIADNPRLASVFPEMKSAMAAVLNILPPALSIKATTNEGLGAVGREEAMAAWAVALLQSQE